MGESGVELIPCGLCEVGLLILFEVVNRDKKREEKYHAAFGAVFKFMINSWIDFDTLSRV